MKKLYEYSLMLLTLAAIGGMFYFAGVAYNLHQRLYHAAMIEHEGVGETVMITHHGKVISEWEPKDGDIYGALDDALHAK